MQELYIIREVACHKPWRYSGNTYTTNKSLFEFLKNSKETFLPNIDWSGYAVYDEDFVYNIMQEGSVVNPEYPFIVLGEVEVYTE